SASKWALNLMHPSTTRGELSTPQGRAPGRSRRHLRPFVGATLQRRAEPRRRAPVLGRATGSEGPSPARALLRSLGTDAAAGQRGDMARLGLLVFGLIAGLALRAHAAPDAITFTLSHADCGPTREAGDDRFRLFMNGTQLADVPTSVGCHQSNAPLVVRITDPTGLAGFDPAACNTFRVDMTRESFGIELASVAVTVEGGPGAGRLCLFDGVPTNPHPSCARRPVFSGAYSEGLPAVGGVDPDGDGMA